MVVQASFQVRFLTGGGRLSQQCRLVEFLVVDPHGEGIHLHHPAFEVDLVEADLVAQQPPYRAQKMAFVVVGVEADQVGPEQAPEHLVPPGQGAEDFVGREGDVEEKADGEPGAQFPQHLGYQHELVVVHPNQVVVGRRSRHGIGKFAVDRHIGLPVGQFKLGVFHEVVEQRPDGAVAEAKVEPVNLFLAQGHPGTAQFCKGLVDLGVEGFRDVLARQAAPSDPKAFPLSVHRFHPGGQPPNTGLCFQRSVANLQLNGQAI